MTGVKFGGEPENHRRIADRVLGNPWAFGPHAFGAMTVATLTPCRMPRHRAGGINRRGPRFTTVSDGVAFAPPERDSTSTTLSGRRNTSSASVTGKLNARRASLTMNVASRNLTVPPRRP
jgi:hypothetical protein